MGICNNNNNSIFQKSEINIMANLSNFSLKKPNIIFELSDKDYKSNIIQNNKYLIIYNFPSQNLELFYNIIWQKNSWKPNKQGNF